MGPWSYAYGRVLGGCVFFQVRDPCRDTGLSTDKVTDLLDR